MSMIVAVTTARAQAAQDGTAGMERLMAAPTGIVGSDMAEDGDVIRMTPDKTQIVRLKQDAASVIVTNPAHASVLLDSPRLLIVMPRIPGSTSFTVLNDAGQVIAEKTVIVSATVQPKYVRIRRMCDTAGAGCVPTAYFYCPDGCYEVLTVPPDNGATNVPEIRGGRSFTMDVDKAPPPALPTDGSSTGAAAPAMPAHMTPDSATPQQAPAQ